MFKVTRKSKLSNARVGVLRTARGEIATPFFMPDATRGFVKTLRNFDLARIGMGPMVVNTYHLLLQPKVNIIKKAGGIHKFMDWNRPLLSDSGGFQIFSLVHRHPKMGKINNDKVVFRSPLDGSRQELTPEKSIQIQFDLGVDLMVCLDDCPPNDFPKKKIEEAVARTIYWAARCKREHARQIKKRKIKGKDRPLLFSVIQGGVDLKLRKFCAEELVKIGFDGYGFGAMPVDKQGKFLKKILKQTASFIPENSLRFALGVGTPADIIKCVAYGWDIFDCVIPTREGRHGKLFLWKRNLKFAFVPSSVRLSSPKSGRGEIRNSKLRDFHKTININNAKFARDFSPINPYSRLEELRRHSKAYLRHLFKSKEPLGAQLASLNNLEFYLDLFETIRENIRAGKF